MCVSRSATNVATGKRVTLDFLRMVVDRSMTYYSRTCVFDGLSTIVDVINISSCYSI